MNMPFDEKEFMKMIYESWEKQWKEEKNDRVATIHNSLIEVLAKEKAHIDEVIIALEILLRESVDEKMTQIHSESKIAVETLPREK
jgi:hypothetical protein